MTTQTTASDHRRWWQYAGPWPLYPLADGLVAGLIALSVRSFIMTPGTVPLELLNAALFGAVVFAVLETARRYAHRVVATLGGYLLALITALGAATALRQAMGYLPDYSNLPPVGDYVFGVFRGFVGLVILQAIIGALQERLQRQVDATQEALHLVEDQAEALLRADEEIRHTVAGLLHDRVQGGILASCIRLQEVAAQHPEAQQSVESIIGELEQLRTFDVKRAVRTLSPSLEDIDLETALKDLVEPYEPAITVTITMPRNAVVDPLIRLAAYRIIEQGLLNAVGHGHARAITVTVTPAPHRVGVTVADDGRGLDPSYARGFGSTIIDTWCRSLGGTWRLEPLPLGGTILTAWLPTHRGEAPSLS